MDKRGVESVLFFYIVLSVDRKGAFELLLLFIIQTEEDFCMNVFNPGKKGVQSIFVDIYFFIHSSVAF